MSRLLGRAAGRLLRASLDGAPAAQWRGVTIVDAAHHDRFLAIVGNGLALIEERSPVRARRLASNLSLILNARLPGQTASFGRIGDERICYLDLRQVDAVFEEAPADPDDDPRVVFCAATLVHEATHAAVDAAGIRYDRSRRERIERLCCREAVRFMRRLSGDDPEAIALAEQAFGYSAGRFAAHWQRGSGRQLFEVIRAQFRRPR